MTDKKFTDERLDELLGDVQIPEALKDKLLAIPTQHPVSTPQTQTDDSVGVRTGVWLLALAAVLLGVALFLAPQFFTSQDNAQDSVAVEPNNDGQRDPSVVSNDGKKPSETIDVATIEKELEALRLRKASLLTQLEDYESTLELQTKLNRINVESQRVSEIEAQSLIHAIADQTVVEFGGSLETLQRNMVSVTKQFPDTRGETIARSVIQKAQN